MSDPARKRFRKGCLWILVAIALFLAVEVWDRKVRQPELAQAFRAALKKDGRQAQWADHYQGLGLLPGPSWAMAEDFGWARAIDGWDRLVVIGPYGRGSNIAWRAAQWNPWVFASVATTEGFPQDGIHTCLVVHHGRVVATLYFEGWPAYYDVVERDP